MNLSLLSRHRYKSIVFVRFSSCLLQTLQNYSNFPRISQSQNRVYSSSPIFRGVPPYSGSNTRSPTLQFIGSNFPLLSMRPGPTAITYAISMPCPRVYIALIRLRDRSFGKQNSRGGLHFVRNWNVYLSLGNESLH